MAKYAKNHDYVYSLVVRKYFLHK